jgi:hypothetical protein
VRSAEITNQPSGIQAVKAGLAFKAYEIEELADRWFFRPAGALIAYAASLTPMTPNQLTLIGLVIGVASGALLYWPALGMWAFGGLILHSVLDSADGQLARIKNMFSIEGRILDGVGGYFTHIAIYSAILCGWLSRGGGLWLFVPWLAAGLCNAVHAAMYDYNRNQYNSYAIKGQIPKAEKLDTSTTLGKLLSMIYGDYDDSQKRLAGLHGKVVDELQRRWGAEGKLPPAASEAYRKRYYWMVRGWNFLGDNTRFYAIGVVAWLGRPELFIWFVLTVMNLALVTCWLAEQRVDRRYLEDLKSIA